MYFNQGNREVEVGVTPDRTHLLGKNTQAKSKQYRLKYHMTSAIHGNFQMWNRGQIIVILSQIKLAENTIFNGNNNGTIVAMNILHELDSCFSNY